MRSGLLFGVLEPNAVCFNGVARKRTIVFTVTKHKLFYIGICPFPTIDKGAKWIRGKYFVSWCTPPVHLLELFWSHVFLVLVHLASHYVYITVSMCHLSIHHLKTPFSTYCMVDFSMVYSNYIRTRTYVDNLCYVTLVAQCADIVAWYCNCKFFCRLP